jgi:hypothetical protein
MKRRKRGTEKEPRQTGANSQKYPVYRLDIVQCTRPLNFEDSWQGEAGSAEEAHAGGKNSQKYSHGTVL